MIIRIATAKVPKWGLPVSGDTVEVVERPRGGMTAILADGQGHGRAAKRTSTLVASRAVTLLGEGARDGAVARAVHDVLHAGRDGQVSADLTLLSVDLQTRTLVVSRNANTPVLVRHGSGAVEVLDQATTPIGVHAMLRPAILEWPLEPGCVVVAMSDGIWEAGRSAGTRVLPAAFAELLAAGRFTSAQDLADAVLELGLVHDHRRPQDDMAAVVVMLDPDEAPEHVRRLQVEIPC